MLILIICLIILQCDSPKKEQFIPNIEFKFVKDDVDYYSLTEAIEVVVNDNTLNISPLELQIAYKMFLAWARRMI